MGMTRRSKSANLPGPRRHDKESVTRRRPAWQGWHVARSKASSRNSASIASEDVVKLGDMIGQVHRRDEKGRVKLSRKAAMQVKRSNEAARNRRGNRSSGRQIRSVGDPPASAPGSQGIPHC